jgi:hypothetical protein
VPFAQVAVGVGGRGVSRVLVLGPQRRPTVDAVVRGLDRAGPIGVVNAGWQEREPDDAELDGLLDGRSVNLRLYARWLDVLEQDPEYAAAEREHRAALAERQELYLVQLAGVLGALREVARYGGSRAEVREPARADAEAAVRLVDERHLTRVHEAHAAFEALWRPGERAAVARHREAVRQRLDEVPTLVLTGGHVGVLLHVLQLFAVTRPPVVIAWSAGAMALTERVLLFHDRAPHGPAHAEFAARGLGWLTGCVLLPHARRRLHTEDPARMAELAVRAAPARCVVLDDGTRLDLDGASLPNSARVVTADGRIGEGVAG